RQDLRDHVDLVVEPFREQRADRAVDQTAGECFLFGGAAFTLEEAARDASGGGELFLVVHGQGEEILSFLDRLGGGNGAQHHGFAVSGEDRPISLTGNAAGFQSEGLSAPLQRYGFRVEHWFSLDPRALLPRGVCCRVCRPGPVWGLSGPEAPSPDCEGCRMQEAARRGAASQSLTYEVRASGSDC